LTYAYPTRHPQRPRVEDQLCYKVSVTTDQPDEKPRIEPLDPPMVPFAVGGMAAFAVAGVIVLLAQGPTEWRWICLAGVLTGIPGLLTMLRHDRNRRRRRLLTHPDFHVTETRVVETP
jgi:hypothetical protein